MPTIPSCDEVAGRGRSGARRRRPRRAPSDPLASDVVRRRGEGRGSSGPGRPGRARRHPGVPARARGEVPPTARVAGHRRTGRPCLARPPRRRRARTGPRQARLRRGAGRRPRHRRRRVPAAAGERARARGPAVRGRRDLRSRPGRGPRVRGPRTARAAVAGEEALPPPVHGVLPRLAPPAPTAQQRQGHPDPVGHGPVPPRGGPPRRRPRPRVRLDRRSDARPRPVADARHAHPVRTTSRRSTSATSSSAARPSTSRRSSATTSPARWRTS